MFVEADARVAYAGTISVRTGKLAAATCRTVVSLAPTEEAGRVQQQTNRALLVAPKGDRPWGWPGGVVAGDTQVGLVAVARRSFR